MYRPEVKVLDCTIRDGGLMNDWHFDKAMVKDVFHHLAQAGVDYVELGYRADKKQFSPAEFGPWRFSEEEDLRDVAYPCDTKVSVMADVGRTDYESIAASRDSIVHMYRVATYLKDIDEAIAMGRHLKGLGYVVAVNIMAVSHAPEAELDEALARLAETDLDMFYLVDSFGYFQIEQVQYLAEKYIHRLKGKQLGMHAHNNQQLGFANTVEAALKGFHYLDATVFGIGRAAGNCPLELIVSFLRNPKYDVRPILELIQKHFLQLKQDLRWGYEIPYAVTGILNQHPSSGLAMMKDEGGSYREFYDSLVSG